MGLGRRAAIFEAGSLVEVGRIGERLWWAGRGCGWIGLRGELAGTYVSIHVSR